MKIEYNAVKLDGTFYAGPFDTEKTATEWIELQTNWQTLRVGVTITAILGQTMKGKEND